MAAQQYYQGDQNFPPPPPPPPPSQANFNGAPPPYSVQAPPHIYGPPPQSPQPLGPNIHPQVKPVPWQQAYNSHNHYPSQHYYAPYSPTSYPPQQGQAQGRPNRPYPRRSPSPYEQRPHRPYHDDSRDHSPSDGYRSSSEHRRRHHKHQERSPSKSKRNHESRDGLLGAAGGGLIGDLILPGAGTLTGIVIGAIKGREHGRKKDDRHDY